MISIIICVLILLAAWIWPKYNGDEKSIEWGFYNNGKRKKVFLKKHIRK